MGTRHLIAVKKDDQYKIAQYGQWDGYPSGQGLNALSFLSKKNNINKLKSGLARCRFFDGEGQDKEWIESYNNACPEYIGDRDLRTPQQKYWAEKFISRDLGAEILNSVANSEGECLLKNSIAFVGDSLFCEYAYVIDFDLGTFEVFKGFNKCPITKGRFISGAPELISDKEYHPVKLIKTYSLSKLPNKKEFLADFEPTEEEED